MQLTDQQIAQIKQQTGVEPIPQDHPETEKLAELFGQQTFFVDKSGLHFFEAADSKAESGQCEVKPVRVATWTDENRAALVPHDPVMGSMAVTIDNGK